MIYDGMEGASLLGGNESHRSFCAVVGFCNDTKLNVGTIICLMKLYP